MAETCDFTATSVLTALPSMGLQGTADMNLDNVDVEFTGAGAGAAQAGAAAHGPARRPPHRDSARDACSMIGR